MEFALLLRALWSRKWLVTLGVLVALAAAILRVDHVSFAPPALKSRSLSYATARTQVIVDAPDSSLADLGTDLNPLIVRAGVYSRLLTSPDALRVIGREAGVNPGLIFAQGPFETNQPRAEQEPTAEQRSSQIVGETNSYRLQFESSPELPIITIFAQAPTTDEANRLATGAAQGLSAYVRQLQLARLVPAAQRVEIRQLGQPAARTVNSGVGMRMGVLIFFLVFVVWCAALLVISRLVSNWRAAGRIVEQGEGGWPGSPSGPGERPPAADGEEDRAGERREAEPVR
ncbi:YveK family protein [Capillimicrobium parvum]|uniref:Uncharacterized protein n=1 Tax=Capillimicrobium parvum TaxID=2884022 RepID=A0A9E6Y092_9ACTN|nr:hypothetical protein [Capillimicrobium parvum]UGS37745.1 hypothetical protein DSM104329_04166 [Capillimicrobium parvum]